MGPARAVAKMITARSLATSQLTLFNYKKVIRSEVGVRWRDQFSALLDRLMVWLDESSRSMQTPTPTPSSTHDSSWNRTARVVDNEIQLFQRLHRVHR